MDLTHITTIKELLAQANTKPSRTYGQNFLIHQPSLDIIIKTANLTPQDIVIEIGPGIGTLTQELAKKAKKVIAIEKDPAMVEILKETLKGYNNIEIIHGDALAFESSDYGLSATDYKVIANIPYYITSPLIRKFLEEKNQPKQIVLMVQKEVAERICATPPKMSILAVSVQFYAKANIITTVKKGCFWPSPTVDSAIVQIIPDKNKPLVDVDAFFRVVKTGFAHPRKQLGNNLSKSFNNALAWLAKNGLDPKQRAETLTIQDWINLTQSIE